MTYAELIKKLEPHKDEEVWFEGLESSDTTDVYFYGSDGDYFLNLSRIWGKDEIQINERV